MSNHLRTAATVLLVVGVIVALSTASIAQTKAALPKYDPKTEVHINKAIVLDTKEITLPNGQQRFRLTIKSGDDTQEVCLCPKAFLDTMDSSFAKDDVVEIVGSKVDDNGKPLILAREVTKGQNTLVLRDKKGEPVWTWMEKKPAEGK